MASASMTAALVGLDEKNIDLWSGDGGQTASLYLHHDVRIVIKAAYVDRAETLAGLRKLAAVTAKAIAALEQETGVTA
jgi:hypothetical protein